jgi:hypothetical protein
MRSGLRDQKQTVLLSQLGTQLIETSGLFPTHEGAMLDALI